MYYAHPIKGFKFAITELGMEQYQVRSKFAEGYENKKQYEHAVPKTWVTKGYVVSVEEDK